MPYNPDGSFFSIHENEIVLNKRNGHTHNGQDSTLVYIPPGSITKDKLAPGVLPKIPRERVPIIQISQPGTVRAITSGRYSPIEDEMVGGIQVTLDTPSTTGSCVVDVLYNGSIPTQVIVNPDGSQTTISPWEISLNSADITKNFNRTWPIPLQLSANFDGATVIPDYIQVKVTPAGGEKNLVVTVWKI